MQQIAQVIRQIGIDAFDQGIPRKVAVLPQIDFPQQEIADRVRAELFDQQYRVDDIAFGFGHLVALDHQPAVTVDFLRQFYAQGHQNDRPDDAVEPDNLLADQMHVRRPELGEFFPVVQIAGRRDIVGQRVEPDVNDMLTVEGNRNSPVERGPGHAEIFEALLDEVDHLVAAGNRLNELWVVLDVLQQAVLIFGHTEEITFLLHHFHRSSAIRTVAVRQLALQPESFTGGAIPAFIGGFINIPLIVYFLKNCLNYFVMAFFRRPDKIVIADAEFFPQHLE